MILPSGSVTATEASGAAAASAAAGVAAWQLPFDFIAIPAAVVFMAFAGTAAGLVVHPPSDGTTRIRTILIAGAFTGFAAVSAVILREFGLLPKAGPAVAFLAGFFAQALIPAARERLKVEVGKRGAPGDS